MNGKGIGRKGRIPYQSSRTVQTYQGQENDRGMNKKAFFIVHKVYLLSI